MMIKHGDGEIIEVFNKKVKEEEAKRLAKKAKKVVAKVEPEVVVEQPQENKEK